jgi:glyoxylate reductase
VAGSPKVLIARRLPRAGFERIAERCEIRQGGLSESADRLRELSRGVDGLVADPSVIVDGSLLEAAGPQLRVVANFAVGYDNVDLEACRERGIVVTNTPEVLTDATAELALALTLAAARHIVEAERDLRAGRWTGFDPEAYLGQELSGASFGVVGMGRIGSRYAELIAGLAGEILYTSRTPKPLVEQALGAVQAGLDELLARSDVVSLHLPATALTAGLIGRDQLRSMKSSAILVNTARGSLIDSSALAEALQVGEIGSAGLDVHEGEPQIGNEILAAPNCVLLPHVGSATTRAREAMASLVADNLLAALAGGEPPNRVA